MLYVSQKRNTNKRASTHLALTESSTNMQTFLREKVEADVVRVKKPNGRLGAPQGLEAVTVHVGHQKPAT